MPKITTFLAYDDQAEAAATLYVSLFPNSRITGVTRLGEGQPGEVGNAVVVDFQLDGQAFIAMSGGPHFKLTDAVSLSVDCKTQEEVDLYWERLSEGGEQGQCGWLRDRFGLWWQINPTVLSEMLGDPDPEKARRTMEAMLQMTKIDIAALRRAYEGQ